MGSQKSDWPDMEKLLEEIEQMQHARTLACGRRILPYLTADDMLQPNDFPVLENHPEFRYEEGVLEGIRTVRMAVSAFKQDCNRRETQTDSVV